MKDKRDVDSVIMYSYIGVETLLYIIFVLQDLWNVPSSVTKYLSICICVLAALYLMIEKGEMLILGAMAFTLLADTFLLLLDEYYILGVLAFCVVQTLYAGRLVSKSSGKSIVPRIVLFFVALVIINSFGVMDMLTVACAWSFSQLVSNVMHAFLIRNKFKGGWHFVIGLLLFLGCDTCVGLNNLMEYIPEFPFSGIIPLAAFCMWIFYLPAQVLIVLSFWKTNRNKMEKDILKYEA